ncbi:MAG: hypothetical protein J5494_05770 [Candidatus Methanomethylophilaceae archaeon]|nr:hypothetical protein [Candidatus Methanomethylophilaceae archaeon]
MASSSIFTDPGLTDLTDFPQISVIASKVSLILFIGFYALLRFGDFFGKNSFVDDPHVHGVMLEQRGCGYDRGVGLHLGEGFGQIVELDVSLLDGSEPLLVSVAVFHSGERGVVLSTAVRFHGFQKIFEVVRVHQGAVGSGVVVREIDYGNHELGELLAEIQYLIQRSEHLLLPGYLHAQTGLDLVVLPPAPDVIQAFADRVVHGFAVPVFVDSETGDHDISFQSVYDYRGVLDASYAGIGEHLVPEIHVVRGVDRELHVQMLSEIPYGFQLAERADHAGGLHRYEIVGVIDGLLWIVYDLFVPVDSHYEIGGDVFESQTDLVDFRGPHVSYRPDHLYFQCAEAQVVNISDTVL